MMIMIVNHYHHHHFICQNMITKYMIEIQMAGRQKSRSETPKIANTYFSQLNWRVKPCCDGNCEEALELQVVETSGGSRGDAGDAAASPSARTKIFERLYYGHCGETADQIRMPFGVIGQTGPGMRQVVGFGNRSTGRSTFGANLGRAIVTSGDFTAYVYTFAATRPS